jgi:hypothetical protein
MPGIVGLVRADGADVEQTVASAARKLQHLDSLTMRAKASDGVGLAAVWRDEPRPDRDWHDDAGVAVRIAGHILQDGPSPRRLRASDIARAYRESGRVPLEHYDGAFTIVVVDRARRRVTVSNDRIGAYPLYYGAAHGAVAFAPEAKAVLAAAAIAPRLRREGVVSLLAFGYCLGRTTLFEDVHCLEPASTLTIDLDSLAYGTERYWNLRFRGTRELRNRAHAEKVLYETLRASQSLILCDDPPSYEVLLSGGLDSRGVVAFADALGKRPSAAFTWGATPSIPDSDAFVARRIADAYHVPHRFLAYDTGDFVAHARDWAYVSELANDNVGWCAEGQPTLTRVYRSGAAFTIAGDVVWDSGGFVFSESEMRQNVVSPDLPPALTACLGRHADEGRHVFDDQINQTLASCEHDDLTDRKDYFYLNARVARFIMSLGYYREHAIEVRRPFLTRAAIDLFAGLPQSHRVEKNIYVSMLRDRFARLMEIPEQSVDSLPNWEHDVRAQGALREFLLHYLDRGRVEGGALATILDGDAFVARRDAYFATAAPPPVRPPLKARFPLRERLLPFVQRHRAVDRLSRLVRKGSAISRRTDFDVLRSIALVTMLEESLDRFSASPMR